MGISTKNSLLERIADSLGANKRFHEYEEVALDADDNAVISPVEATVIRTGDIDHDGRLRSKNGRYILLENLIGDNAGQFTGENYINLYLKPSNKHFWVTPYEGMFTYTQKNEGNSWPPVFVGLENLLGIEMLSKAVRVNASIGSLFRTKDFTLAMIAIGSLNVNGIHADYEEMRTYNKGTPCGYFSIGSSMLLCFPKRLELLVAEGSDVKMGQKILTYAAL